MSANTITIDEVRHVAKLARLELSEAELTRMTRQLEPILGYVAKISQLNVDNVLPMAHALPLHNVLREDVIEPPLPLERVLQNAPEVDGAFFAVPKILGGDEDSVG